MDSDLISRKAMNERLHKLFVTDYVYEKLNELPTVDAVEVREARWKGTGFGDYQCSWCGEVVSGCKDNYCRECGSKMDVGDKEEQHD